MHNWLRTLSFIALRVGTPVILLLTAVLCAAAQEQEDSLAVLRRQGHMAMPSRAEGFNDHFLDAVSWRLAGNRDSTYATLQRCIDINPNAPEAWFMLSDYYAEQEDSAALRCIERAAALNPANDTYQERLAMHYIGAGDIDAAINTYEHLYDGHHSRIDVLAILLELYQHKKDYPGMINTLSRLEQMEGLNEDIALATVQAYERMGNKKMAQKTLRRLAAEFPNEENYRVMLGNWLMQNNKQKEAYKIFTTALKKEPDNSYAMESLSDYYVAAGQDSLAMRLRTQILTNRATPVETKVTILQQLVRESEQADGDSTRLLSLMDRIIESDPKDSEIPMFKAVYMRMKEMPTEEVDDALRHVLSVAPDNAMARFSLLQDLWTQKDWDEVVAVSQPGTEYNPEEMAFYYFNGLAWFQKDEHDRALDAFQRGVSQINEKSNPEIVSDFYAIMGDILHQKGLYDQAFEAYDSCLQWKDDNVACLNNYAYYLSILEEKGERSVNVKRVGRREELLQKAEEMSRKTVQAEPENSTYLDTYAWILFLQGRNEEALNYIDQAIRHDTDPNAVITEHAGDIHAATGDIDGAVALWQKAYEQDDGDIDKDLLLKKIVQRRYIKKEDE